METKRTFKPIEENHEETLLYGQSQPKLPIGKSLKELGLQEANAYGEANTIKPIAKKTSNRKPPKPKVTTLKDYPNNRKIEIAPKVFIVLDITSKIQNTELESFEDFIYVSESTVDIVDIIPNLYTTHYDIIKHSSTRILKGDKVIVNFKYKSLDNKKAQIQQEPVIVKDVKFKALNDKTAIIAYLENNDFYPINELDRYDTD